jgi:hypothetical protein
MESTARNLRKPLENLNEKIDRFLLKWNSITVDYWWRKTYNVPFGSRKHREMTLLDMQTEWRERVMLDPRYTDIQKEMEEQKEDDELYENIDLSDFDEK